MLECTLVDDEAIGRPTFHVFGEGILDFEVTGTDEEVESIGKGRVSRVYIHVIIIYLFRVLGFPVVTNRERMGVGKEVNL